MTRPFLSALLGLLWLSAPADTGLASVKPAGWTAFGENYAPGTSVTVAQRYAFQGREAGVAGAPMFYRNRAYFDGLGRFGRRDLKLGGDPLYNAYGFPTEAPVMRGDPYGTDSITVDDAPCGKWKIRNAANIEIGAEQQLAAGGNDELDGFEVEFGSEGCVCKGAIRVVQAIETGGWMSGRPAHMDVGSESEKKNKETKGGIPVPGYVESGGRAGKHGNNSYLDAPYNPASLTGNVTWTINACAVCTEECKQRNMGCVAFTFIHRSKRDGTILERKVNVRGAKEMSDEGDTWHEIASSKPGSIWTAALKKWEEAGGTEAK